MAQPSELRAGGARPPVWIEPDADLRAAATRMARRETSSILVGSPGSLVSILTERDLARAVAQGLPHSTPVSDVAVPRPLAVESGTSLHDVGIRMLETDVRHLVVTRDNRAVGVVSMRDVLRAMLMPVDTIVLLDILEHELVGAPENWLG